jgi:gamma-glutamyltranspeptidase/glutathione hydrolase
MGEDDLHPDGFHASPPGMRVASMMSPSLLLRDGRVQLVLGSGGSKRIRTAILQVISNIVDFGMSLEEAVTALRLHWDGERVQIEPGFDDAELALLRQQWDINVWSVKDIYFGGVHAVAPQCEAVGDARRGGHSCVL